MKRDILILSALCTCCNLFAEEITVKYLRYAGPYEIKGPFIVDSLDVNSKKFTDAELLKTAIPFNNVRESNLTLDAATTAGQSKNSSVSLAHGKAGYALYPVWLLNTTWNGQKYIFAMNGQTGKFVGNLPVDNGLYAKYFAAIAAVSAAVSYGLMWLALM